MLDGSSDSGLETAFRWASLGRERSRIPSTGSLCLRRPPRNVTFGLQSVQLVASSILSREFCLGSTAGVSPFRGPCITLWRVKAPAAVRRLLPRRQPPRFSIRGVPYEAPKSDAAVAGD